MLVEVEDSEDRRVHCHGRITVLLRYCTLAWSQRNALSISAEGNCPSQAV